MWSCFDGCRIPKDWFALDSLINIFFPALSICTCLLCIGQWIRLTPIHLLVRYEYWLVTGGVHLEKSFVFLTSNFKPIWEANDISRFVFSWMSRWQLDTHQTNVVRENKMSKWCGNPPFWSAIVVFVSQSMAKVTGNRWTLKLSVKYCSQIVLHALHFLIMATCKIVCGSPYVASTSKNFPRFLAINAIEGLSSIRTGIFFVENLRTIWKTACSIFRKN